MASNETTEMDENPYQSPMTEPSPLFGKKRRRPYTPERAYHSSVIPMAAFMFFGGLIFVAASILSPLKPHMPPIESPWLARFVFGGIGVYLSILGIGFFRLSRLALWGFYAYIVLGSIWQVFLPMFDSRFSPWLALAGPVFNVLITVGIYLTVRPAFANAARVKRRCWFRSGHPACQESSNLIQ